MKQQSENVLFDINSLISKVKRTFHGFQHLNIDSSNIVDTKSILRKISQENKYLLEILRKNKECQPSLHKQIIEKIRIKIKDWILSTKNKYQGTMTHKYLNNMFNQLELMTKIYENSQNFIQFISKIYSIINDTLRMLKIKFDLFSENLESPSSILNCKLKIVDSFKKRPLNLNIKDLKAINFSAFYSLELDNGYIRSSMQLTQRGQIQWLHSQLQRNKHTQREIEGYQNLYFLYLQKQRNKNRPFLCPKIQNKAHLRVKTTIHDKLYHNFQSENSRKNNTKDKQNAQSQMIKDACKISKLYVCGNEFDLFCENTKNQAIKSREEKKRSSLLLCRAFRDSLTTKNSTSYSKQLIKFLK